jgi:uncharacterized damage-inducible protein DinB
MALSPVVRDALWNQLGAAIDTLGDAIGACPDHEWGATIGEREIWYLAFHTLFFLDLYLTGTTEGFAPPPPFGLEELDPAGVLPPRIYTREELRGYQALLRARALDTIGSMDEADAARLCRFWWEMPYLELLLYTARHTQHHAAQINLLLRQRTDAAPRWVGRARHHAP